MKPERDPMDVAVGAELRKRRVAARLSLADVGKGVGVTYQQVQKYESGANRVAFATAVRLAEFIGFDGDELVAAAVSAVETSEHARPRAPSARALALAQRVDRLPAGQRTAIDRIVEAILDSPNNRADLAEVARDGHPALSYAH
ncbi:helix-turn-helix domain-containing protein [Aureimonas phyllosphaerae]|uniref:helix-turn-helix domain-containing protein n=1 Tax=Aureimonas phyllosphaerae TaxID=1166078 RepID=UPI003A5BB274